MLDSITSRTGGTAGTGAGVKLYWMIDINASPAGVCRSGITLGTVPSRRTKPSFLALAVKAKFVIGSGLAVLTYSKIVVLLVAVGVHLAVDTLDGDKESIEDE